MARSAECDPMATALVTGFEPYGGRGLNPSALLARALDGAQIAGLAVAGRCLPVAMAGLGERIETLLAETQPSLVVALGLAPGEPVIRLDRFSSIATCSRRARSR